MKNKKKILAVAIAVIMLMSAVSFNSFAALDFLKAPEVESVAFTDSQSLSLKDFQLYRDSMDEIMNEYGDLFENFTDDSTIHDYLYSYRLDYSSVDHNVEITMSDGTKASASVQDGYVDLNKVYRVEVYAYVPYDKFVEASESGADTVDVTVETSVYSNLLGRYTQEEPKAFTLEKSLTDCFVKSISEISGVPSEICADGDYYCLDGAEFLVEYADGRKENYTVKTEFGELFPTYKLGDSKLGVYDEEGKLYIQYLDEMIEKEITYVEEPFESIKITDCVYDAENLVLSSLSYTIEWKDGRKESYTYAPSAAGMTVLLSEIVERVDGFYVYVDSMPFETDFESGDINYDKIKITVSVGSELSDSYEMDSPYAKPLNTLTSIAKFFSGIISVFRNIISFLLNIGSVG